MLFLLVKRPTLVEREKRGAVCGDAGPDPRVLVLELVLSGSELASFRRHRPILSKALQNNLFFD